MKKKGFLLFPLVFASLAGCSLSPGNYYTVNIYSDYEGMEEDLASGGYKASKATLMGVAYALKNQAANVDSPKATSADGDYTASTRTAPHGYAYKFDKLVGQYQDGTAVNLKEITSNCDVFATFTQDPKDYRICVESAFGDYIFNEFLTFGSKFSDSESLVKALSTAPVHNYGADPADASTWRDVYHLDYSFDKWEAKVYDEDDKLTDAFEFGPDYDFSTLTISDKTTIAPVYAESEKTYRVDVSYQLMEREDDGLGNLIPVYKDLPGQEGEAISVLYGQKLTPKDIAGYQFLSAGKNGQYERYAYSDTLPLPLRELYQDDEGQYQYRGNVIDINYIAYDCAITLVYEAEPVIHEVTFHIDPADEDSVIAKLINDGRSVLPPDVINLPSGKAFHAWGRKVGSDYAVYDLSEVHEDIDLYPILVDVEVTNANSFTFRYDHDLMGYVLINAPDGCLSVNEALLSTVFDFDLDLVGVFSFGVGKSTITSITLPKTVFDLEHGVFADLYQVTSIDLSKTEIISLPSGAFRDLANLTEVRLPSTLLVVGNDLFANCPSMSDIYIDLTVSEVGERDFAAHWNSGITVIYKS